MEEALLPSCSACLVAQGTAQPQAWALQRACCSHRPSSPGLCPALPPVSCLLTCSFLFSSFPSASLLQQLLGFFRTLTCLAPPHASWPVPCPGLDLELGWRVCGGVFPGSRMELPFN